MKIHITSKKNIFLQATRVLVSSLKKIAQKKTLILLSGGTAVSMYWELVEFLEGYKGIMAIAQVDERFRPGNLKLETRNSNKNSNINSQIIGETGLWEACKKKNIPYYPISQEGTLEEAAGKYNAQMEKLFKDYDYKIAVLGIGEDAHTAGLLPGYSKVWDTDELVAGYENNGQFPERISLTPKALQILDQAIVVAVGAKKKEAIKNSLNPLNIDKYPAVIVQKIKKVDLFTDQIIHFRA